MSGGLPYSDRGATPRRRGFDNPDVAREAALKSGKRKKGTITAQKRAENVLNVLLNRCDEELLKKIDVVGGKNDIIDLKQSNLLRLIMLRTEAKTFTEKFVLEKEIAKYVWTQKVEEKHQIEFIQTIREVVHTTDDNRQKIGLN